MRLVLPLDCTDRGRGMSCEERIAQVYAPGLATQGRVTFERVFAACFLTALCVLLVLGLL